MEITVTQNKLAKALANLSRVAAGRTTLPILNNILIRVENKKVSLIATNLDMAIVDFLPVSDSKDGVITAPARLLTDFISNLPHGESVTITSKDSKLAITAGQYSSTINGVPADDFPELPELDEKSAVIFKIGADEFKHAINRVITATASDLDRPAFTGVYFNTDGKDLLVTALDGYRIAFQRLIKNVKSEVKVIVPTPTLHEVLRSLSDDVDELEISFSPDLVRFRLGEVEIISKVIDASYPDYFPLIPKELVTKLVVPRDDFLRISRLAALFARRSANGAIICEATTPDTFSVRTVASEIGENDSRIETKVDALSKTSVNSRYLINAINTFAEPEIRVEFGTPSEDPDAPGASSPIVLRPLHSDDYVHLVMPLGEQEE